MKNFFICLLIIVGIGWGWFSLKYPTYHIRYRVSIDIDDNGTVRTGSSVMQDDYVTWTQIIPGDSHGLGIAETHRGYPPVVDLARAVLIARNECPSTNRMGCNRLEDLPERFFGKPGRDFNTTMGAVPTSSDFKDVPPKDMPELICFRDKNNKYTQEELDPLNLEKTLGPGIRLIRLRIQMTEDPITPKPAYWPAWW